MTDVPFYVHVLEKGGVQPARIAPDPADLERLTSQAREYICAAKSAATLRAYRADWRHFEEWCRQKALPPSRPRPTRWPSTWQRPPRPAAPLPWPGG